MYLEINTGNTTDLLYEEVDIQFRDILLILFSIWNILIIFESLFYFTYFNAAIPSDFLISGGRLFEDLRYLQLSMYSCIHRRRTFKVLVRAGGARVLFEGGTAYILY